MTQFTRVVNGSTELQAHLFNDLQEAIEQQSFNVMRYGAVGDGVTDDTAAIVAVIAAMSAGDTLFFPKGTYNLSSRLALNKAMTVIAYGATMSGYGIDINANDVRLIGATVDTVPGYGVWCQGSRCIIRDVKVIDSGNIGITVQTYSGLGRDVEDVVIDRCEVDRSGITAASIIQGGIKVAAATYDVVGTHIENCIVRMPESPTDSTATCIEVHGDTPYSVIAGNTTYGGTMGVSIGGGNGSLCLGNAVYRAKNQGVEVAMSSECAVSGNVVYGNGVTAKGISISNTTPTGIAVTGNSIYDVTTRGIQVQGASSVSVVGNTIVSEGSYGIELNAGTDGAAVLGNVLDGLDTGLKAIVVSESSSIAVTGNMMKDWAQHGVFVEGVSAVTIDYLTVQGNVFDDCTVVYATSLSGGAALGSNVFVTTGYQGDAYTPSNVTTDRAFDANSTSTDELADVLGTLIADLQTLGIVQ